MQLKYWEKVFKLTLKHFLHALKHRRKPIAVAHKNYFHEMRHGSVTLRYPKERLSLPEHARHQLYLYEEDCIACDQCVRICPVNCITIKKEKAKKALGTTRSGHPKRFHLIDFTIDMAQCCYCGLCTVVCPTECLIMLPKYDYATYDRKTLVFSFTKK